MKKERSHHRPKRPRRPPVPWTRRTVGLHREDCIVAGWGLRTSRPRFLVYQCFRLPVVSSLWTPDGERPVGTAPEAGAAGPPATVRPHPPGDGGGRQRAIPPSWTRRSWPSRWRPCGPSWPTRRSRWWWPTTATGCSSWPPSTCPSSPPCSSQARLAIDALGSLVGGLEGRLGEAEEPLKDGLSQLRLAYVQIDGAQRAGAEAASAAGVNGESTGRCTSGPSGPRDGAATADRRHPD